jgi:hypothetical protein
MSGLGEVGPLGFEPRTSSALEAANLPQAGVIAMLDYGPIETT